MLELLKCPACAASLEYSKDGKPILRCPYCNSSIATNGLTRKPAESTATPSKMGAKLGIGVAVVVIVALGVIIRAMIHTEVKPPSPVVVQANPLVLGKPAVIVPASKPSRPAPPPPAFARMVREFGVEGVGPGRFQEAQSIALDGLGHIYVGEFSGGRIQVFDMKGQYLAGWNTGSVKHLLALAADRKGVVYADAAPAILRFDGMTGKPLSALDDMNTDVEEYYRDVFCTVDGDVYAIGGNSHIIRFDADGKIKNTIRANDKVGEAVQFERVLVQPSGEIYALDHDRGVFKFAADGHYINRFGATRGREHLGSPHALASDGKGRIYVSDEGPSVRVFDAEGGFIDTFGKDHAFGLAISDDNRIFASFASRHVVREFALDKP